MKRVFTIGEALIDFTPKEKGVPLKNVTEFTKQPGGAPANVAAGCSKLGIESYYIGKLGIDAFGDYLIDVLQDSGVKTKYIKRTKEANTALAFVSLKEDGNRDFSFYRNPSADLLLHKTEIEPAWFLDDILHFCSVDLVEAPVKYATKKAIESIRERNGVVSFDPNVRKPLWDDLDQCKQTIQEFIPQADIIKVSDEELEFITGISSVEKAIQSLFKGHVKWVLYTLGKDGAKLYTKQSTIYAKGVSATVVDTTGAGDAFIAAILSKVAQFENVFTDANESQLKDMIAFANKVAAISTEKYGAISSLPTIDEVK